MATKRDYKKEYVRDLETGKSGVRKTNMNANVRVGCMTRRVLIVLVKTSTISNHCAKVAKP